MTIGSAREVAAGTVIETDVCVVGSGAAGLTLARELDAADLDVVMLEAGPARRDVRAERELFGVEELGDRARNPEPTRGRVFGGSTGLWFGRIATLDPIDFEHRDWVPDSGWPLAPDDLAPWLRRAAEILAVPDFERIDPAAWDPNPTIETFRRGGDTDVRAFLWSGAADMAEQHRSMLERSRRVRVLLDATVTALVPSERGASIEHLTVARPDGERFEVRARRVVLAAGGLENPRLLLASGIGNDHDLVGRYYMDHVRGEGLAVADLTTAPPEALGRIEFLGERTTTASGAVQLRVTFSERLQRSEELLNHSIHAHLVAAEQATAGFQGARRLAQRARRVASSDPRPLILDVLAVLRDAPALARLAVRKARGDVRPSSVVFIDQMEQAPDRDSRVTVDPRDLDRFGLPRLQTRWRIGDATRRSQRRMHELMATELAGIGIVDFRSRVLVPDAHDIELWDMKHPSGTTRMARSADRGVVDLDARVHGIDNLYVAGSSVFPTVGHANPTLTIVALAARLADHLTRSDQR